MSIQIIDSLNKLRVLLVLVALIFTAIGCKRKVLIPKPHAYPRVIFQSGDYRLVAENYCPLQFEFPSYGEITQQKSFFEDKPADPCWFTISIPALNAAVYCSYGEIDAQKSFDQYVQDAFKLVAKHDIKAEYREERKISHADERVYGMAFELDGPVATPYQFYLTDSLHHFFRAALYFNATVNPDSTKPVLDFLRKDLQHMQSSFEWKNNMNVR